MIIEKVSRSGIVLDHFQFSGGTIKIGRAYDNDLILHDVYVNASHLKLRYDDEHEGFWFEDLASVNGTQVIRSKENRHLKVPANFVSSGDTLCVGKTYLKVRSRAQDVPAAIQISLWDKALGLSGNVWAVVALCITLLGLEILDQHFNNPRMDKFGSKVLDSLNLLFVVLAYGLGWAFVARVQRAEPRLLVHVSLIAWCLLIFSIFDLFKPVIYFNFDATEYGPIIDLVVSSGCIFAIVFASLYLATELKKLLRFLLAALIPLGLSLSLIVGMIQSPEFKPYPEYDAVLVSPAWQWRETVTRERYVELTAGLYEMPDSDDIGQDERRIESDTPAEADAEDVSPLSKED